MSALSVECPVCRADCTFRLETVASREWPGTPADKREIVFDDLPCTCASNPVIDGEAFWIAMYDAAEALDDLPC